MVNLILVIKGIFVALIYMFSLYLLIVGAGLSACASHFRDSKDMRYSLGIIALSVAAYWVATTLRIAVQN